MMSAEAPPMLVVGVTGRALAQSALRGGHAVVVLDYFADRDACAAASACRAVVSPRGLRFDRRLLLSAARDLAPADRSAGLVYGSGFEGKIGLLSRLLAGRRLFGNPPAVVAAVRDPLRFFPLLDRLEIPHPEVRLLAPADTGGWLMKSAGGSGGTQVRAAERRRSRLGGYFQRLHPGRPRSVLFLADGRRASVVGFNAQWNSSARPGLPYLYGGAVSRTPMPVVAEAQIGDRLDALVAATGLLGLNGLDFLLHDGAWSVLELNPRPTATLELYDADFGRGLFDAHLEACQGRLPEAMPTGRMARASLIVHATAKWRVPDAFAFPDWCRDLPQPGTRIAPGDPVCTVFAEGGDAELATTLVRERQQQTESMLREAAATPVGS